MSEFRSLLGDIAGDAKQYDVIDAAIRGARRRRRITVAVPLAALLVLAVLGVGIWLPNRHTEAQTKVPAAHPSAPTAAGPGFDVVSGRTLYTAGGGKVTLPAGVDQAYRLPDGGWLINVVPDAEANLGTMVHLDRDGKQRDLAPNMGGIYINQAATRVAWQHDSTLHEATLDGDRLTDQHSSPAFGTNPVKMVGDDTVVVFLAALGDNAKWDVWHPSKGRYTLTGNPDPNTIFGAAAGSDVLLGMRVPDKSTSHCLTDFTAEPGLAETGKAVCSTQFVEAPIGSVSPFGYLAMTGDNTLLAYRSGKPGWRTWPMHARWIRGWLNGTTALVQCGANASAYLVRVDLTKTDGAITRVALPPGVRADKAIIVPPYAP